MKRNDVPDAFAPFHASNGGTGAVVQARQLMTSPEPRDYMLHNPIMSTAWREAWAWRLALEEAAKA